MKKSIVYLVIFYITIIIQSCSNDSNFIVIEPPIIDLIVEIPSSNTLGVLSLKKDKAFDSYTLFTIEKSTYLINNCGQVINMWVSNYLDGKSVYLLEDGSILRAGVIENNNLNIPGIGGIVEKFDWDGNLIWEYIYSSDNFSQHHDIYPLPNGNVLLLAATRKTQAEALLAGRDPSNLSQGELYNEQMIEVMPIGSNDGMIVWEWNIWDHLIQDFDATKENFGVVENNPQLMDINYLGTSNGNPNWLHFNSMQYNESLDQIIVSSRQTSEILIIDHSTSINEAELHTGGNSNKGGDILYRWGNPIAYQKGTIDDQKLFGQHYPHWIQPTFENGGEIIIFNNGDGRPSNFSSVDIINPETSVSGEYLLESNGVYRPDIPKWSYQDPDDPTGFYSRILSSAQRLANGNTFICEGIFGRFFEIDSDGNVVWEYINPIQTSGFIMSQGETPSSNLTFRAIKYAIDYDAFKNRTLIPKNPIELSFDIGNCQ